MEVDSQIVIQYLTEKLAKVELENATLMAVVRQMQDTTETVDTENGGTASDAVQVEGAAK
ncbi:hypothetical protein [Enterococcus entomosocium]|uniref:hypothetical protein n=1 Tax=Enterococcus entomosocium TaxID=3034352 RepID=UPI002649EB98|nr:hypothetical protein [Enterococcus entomosocium]